MNEREVETSDFHGTWKAKIATGRTVHPTTKLATGPGHPFYSKVNEVLAEAGFDDFVERRCAKYYKDGAVSAFRRAFISGCSLSATLKV